MPSGAVVTGAPVAAWPSFTRASRWMLSTALSNGTPKSTRQAISSTPAAASRASSGPTVSGEPISAVCVEYIS